MNTSTYILTLSIIFYAVTCISSLEDAKINYYMTVIQENLKNIKLYKRPTENYNFKTTKSDTKPPKDYGTFDFIIVGAGTAGAIVATRLSEVDSVKLLVLEAGEAETDFSRIPFFATALRNTSFNWGYLTTSQENSCLAFPNKQCTAPRGKGLGGSNILNAMAYTRGHPLDYDKWKSMGNPGWGSSDVLPYFLKSENSQVDGEPGWHGKDGLWNVEYIRSLSKSVQYFLEANEEIGQKILKDYNTDNLIGASRFQYSQKNGRRQTTANAFFSNAFLRGNVKTQLEALVTKIIVDRNNRATGVEFVFKNEKYIAKASKEVILSAGAYNTPQVLLLSGIGPKEELKKHNIDMIADLPVGQNLIDHPLFTGMTFSTNLTDISGPFPEQIQKYLHGYGPLTIPYFMQAFGFLPAKNGPPQIPMVEYLLAPQPDSSNLQLVFALLHPKSRGSITLKSNNYLDFPNIDYNNFSDENNEDIAHMIDAIHFVIKLMETKTMKAINATLLPSPYCTDKVQLSDEYWECWIRHTSVTIYHPCSTASMGNDSHSVVDARLRVHGVEGLRIVDASIIPSSISGHTNAPTAMIGEKGSDIIKKDYGFGTKQCVTT